MQTVCVIGGAGYVGSVLVPKLLEANYRVVVFDRFIYGDRLPTHQLLFRHSGDVRNAVAVKRAMLGCDSVIHLACISNDPSFALDPELGKQINYESFRPIVRAAKEVGVTRFIYASSSSVYGVRDEANVTEDLKQLQPLTDYSAFKLLCEEVLEQEHELGFTTCVLRPATVCGYSPRQRLDLVVNIMTKDAVNLGTITVHGGDQQRPNIHINDMVDAYMHVLVQPPWKIDRQIFNVGGTNHTLNELASRVVAKLEVEEDHQVSVVHEPSNDMRSYRISSSKIWDKLRWVPKLSVSDAIGDLAGALRDGRLPGYMTDSQYYNIKRMQELQLK